MIVQNYKQFGGAHSETAALKNVLAQSGVSAPHTKKIYSEAMLLGLGGGVGAGYAIADFNQQKFPVIGLRHQWNNVKADFLKRIAQRIGAPVTVKETTGARTAEDDLKEALERNRPVIAWGSLAALPYYGLSDEWLADYVHVFVVYGWNEKARRICVDDRAVVPWHITPDELRGSRSAIPSARSRTLTIAPPKKSADLKAAIIAGISDCCDEMLDPPHRSVGLASLAKWAELLTDAKNEQGWPKIFKSGTPLYRALLATFHSIETAGTGGGAFRLMYADFLDEAAMALDKSAERILSDAAAQYRRSAKLWSGLAKAALPDSVDLLCEAREVTAAKYQLLTARGPAADSQMQKINRRLAAIESEAEKKFPLNPKQTRALLDELSGHVRKIHEAEEKGVAILRKLAA
jgi:hypothetical protein